MYTHKRKTQKHAHARTNSPARTRRDREESFFSKMYIYVCLYKNTEGDLNNALTLHEEQVNTFTVTARAGNVDQGKITVTSAMCTATEPICWRLGDRDWRSLI